MNCLLLQQEVYEDVFDPSKMIFLCPFVLQTLEKGLIIIAVGFGVSSVERCNLRVETTTN
jgi:hypothetical protein